MNVERKFIDLKQLKVTNEGPGFIEGYRSVFNEIDEGGDIVLKGFFADAIPEYMDAGFSAHSHEWGFKDVVGFPVEAKEDDEGFWVKSQFHSTSDAQDIRTKAKERMDAGKKVGFSFGYSITDKEYIDAKDYKERLPLLVKSDRLEANLAKAQKFDRIRLLKKGEVIEDSIVTAPMNKLAAATAIKSETKVECDCPSGTDVADCPHLKKSTPNPEGITEAESFGSFESAETAIKKFAQKMRSYHEIRLKEGRVLSSSNRAKVQACKDSMTALIADLDDLLVISEPKPKEKEISAEALRTHSLRVRSKAVAVLA